MGSLLGFGMILKSTGLSCPLHFLLRSHLQPFFCFLLVALGLLLILSYPHAHFQFSSGPAWFSLETIVPRAYLPVSTQGQSPGPPGPLASSAVKGSSFHSGARWDKSGGGSVGTGVGWRGLDGQWHTPQWVSHWPCVAV